MSLITNLEAHFIPHRRWPLRRWFRADPLWYYHAPRPDGLNYTNPPVLDLIDPDLRPLCRLLYKAGLRTTPSCQGHFHDRQHFQLIFNHLRRDSAAIVSTGLPVLDAETDEPYLFRNPAYVLPWRTFDDFHNHAAIQQGIGYLGILIPPQREALYNSLHSLTTRSRTHAILFDEQLHTALGRHVLSIFVHTPDPDHQAAQWHAITTQFQDLLSRPLYTSRQFLMEPPSPSGYASPAH